MKKATIHLSPEQLQTLSNAMDFYSFNSIDKETSAYCYTFNTQPSGTVDILIQGEDYQSFKKERERVTAIRKHLAYQKRLLKI